MTPNRPLPEPDTKDPPVFIVHGYGHVGQGRTPQDAKAHLLEKMQQSRET